MQTSNLKKEELQNNGYAILDAIYSAEEIDRISDCIAKLDQSSVLFRKTEQLFAIRQFFNAVPDAVSLVFNNKLNALLNDLHLSNYFLVKSIYFDKPASSNWFVAWHQDLTISVDKKLELAGYGPWTNKHQQFAVQPPLAVLENMFTIRIHLDNTDTDNGALKVIPSSHKRGVLRPDSLKMESETVKDCLVKAGGCMLMKPLLMHSSSRTVNQKKRRVIHLEFSNMQLPNSIQWSEKLSLDQTEPSLKITP